jgi:ParB family chromosome partitioning protein
MSEKATGRRSRRFTVNDLFTDTRPQATGVQDLPGAKEIDLSRIEPDPDQPRRAFDDERLEELAASIRAEGVLQPVVVRYDEPRDTYVLVHGERRWRASKLAGQKTIPALVRDVPEHRRLLQQLMENVVRDDLNAVDRAAALRTLRKQLDNAPWEQVAEAVGIKRSRLFQLLGTEKLPDTVRDDIQKGKLSEKQSRALQGLPPTQQEALRALMVEKDVSALVATKIARALKSMVNGDEISHSAAQTQVERLYALIEPADAEALARQTQTLLTAVQQRNTADLAKLLGVPRFDDQRMAREVAALARSLTRADADQLAPNTPIRKSLEQLRAAIDTLLREG